MMQWSMVLLLLSIIALQLFIIRLNRRINSKLIKLTSPERDARALSKNVRDEAWQHYRQSEFYAQLLRQLNPSAPLPPLRSWAASPDLLVSLFDLAQKKEPAIIVDLGSGSSTLILAKACPRSRIISIDNSEEFAAKTRTLLADHGVTNAEVRVAPLTAHSSGVDWYDTRGLSDISSIDLLFIDGPPGSKNAHARHPAFDFFLSKLTDSASIVIDDVNREGEKSLAEKFAEVLPHHTLLMLPHEKGTAIIARG